jgi:hypothetical protein
MIHSWGAMMETEQTNEVKERAQRVETQEVTKREQSVQSGQKKWFEHCGSGR